MSKQAPAAPSRPERAPTGALAALLLLAFTIAPWSVYQWMELVIALDGGSVACAAGPTFDCTAVWFAPAAKTIHHLTGLPVAAWGLVWALAGFVAATRVGFDRMRGRSLAASILGARLVAAAGLVGIVGFSAISLAAGALCPTCLTTYVLVAGYVAVAIFGLRAGLEPSVWVSAVSPVAIAVFGGWGLLLWPGLATPLEPKVDLPAVAATDEPSGVPPDELSVLIEGLPPRGQQALAQAVASLRSAPSNGDVQPRRLAGSPDAPVLLTDFSDVRCAHCKNLVETLHELEKRMGSVFAEDARYFPLSARCNPEIPKEMVDPTGVRCFAAKALLCLEDRPNYFELRRRVFAEQTDLTMERVAELALEVTGADRGTVDRCAESPEVDAKLRADIEYATRYQLQGTPLLLMNGREVPAHPTLLYALLLARGDPDHPAFRRLPSVTSAE